jgi:CPA2 family monovalent cation:H+ antiporter-2
MFTGALIAVSSTTIIAKAFADLGIRGRLRERVVGVLVVEDLIAILLMAVLTAVAQGSGLSAAAVARAAGRLALFLSALLAAGLLAVPRALRLVNRLNRRETTLVASLAVCFGTALLAAHFGYSVALGAFIAGSLVAEGGEEHHVQPVVKPVRDLFGAIFFVSVGLMIDPALVARHWQAIAALTATVIVGKVLGVSLGAFFTGSGVRTSVQAGLSMAQIGEFSFIIAGLGLSLGATGEFLYPVAVAVSALTTATTPWLLHSSERIATYVDRKLPGPLQTFAALYGSWLERLGRGAPPERAQVRRLLVRLLLDTGLLAVVLVGTPFALRALSQGTRSLAGLPPLLYRAVELGGTLLLAAPFCVGIARLARRLGLLLASEAIPDEARGRPDLAAAPRGAIVAAVQIGAALGVGVTLLAITQPFLHGSAAPLLVGAGLVVLGIAFWRSAANLQGHVRAAAQVIVEALARQARGGSDPARHDALAEMRRLLPGLGEPEPLRLDGRCPAVGQTLSQLDLRGRTGATVLAIGRGEASVLVPSAGEVLRAGDVLALAGTREAVEAARTLLSAATAPTSGRSP